MLIDWFTVGAQILNFIVLVWLLQRFLYKPILAAVDARETKIASELADADAKKAEAKKERELFEHKNDVFDKRRADLLAKASEAADAERHKLFDAVHKAADAEGAKRHAAMISDAENLSQAIGRCTQDQVFAIARKVLSDLASTQVEASLGDMFVQQLLALEEKEKARFGKALKVASEAPVVRSAFGLPAAQQTLIQKAVHTAFSFKGAVRFETAPDQIAGIELATTGEKISWSIDDYLKTMQTHVLNMLTKTDSASVRSEPKPPHKKPSVAKTPAKAMAAKMPKPKTPETKSEAKLA